MAKKLAKNGCELSNRILEETMDNEECKIAVKAILSKDNVEVNKSAIMALIAPIPIEDLKELLSLLHNPIVLMQAIHNSEEIREEE